MPPKLRPAIEADAAAVPAEAAPERAGETDAVAVAAVACRRADWCDVAELVEGACCRRDDDDDDVLLRAAVLAA